MCLLVHFLKVSPAMMSSFFGGVQPDGPHVV